MSASPAPAKAARAGRRSETMKARGCPIGPCCPDVIGSMTSAARSPPAKTGWAVEGPGGTAPWIRLGRRSRRRARTSIGAQARPSSSWPTPGQQQRLLPWRPRVSGCVFSTTFLACLPLFFPFVPL